MWAMIDAVGTAASVIQTPTFTLSRRQTAVVNKSVGIVNTMVRQNHKATR